MDSMRQRANNFGVAAMSLVPLWRHPEASPQEGALSILEPMTARSGILDSRSNTKRKLYILMMNPRNRKGARLGKLTEQTSIFVCAIFLSTGYALADAVDV